MSTGLPNPRLLTLLAFALSLLAMLLAVPTIAQGRKAGCSAGHGRRGAHACTAHRHRAHKPRPARHAVPRKRTAAKLAPAGAAEGTVATCEDGSAALPGHRGPSACDDATIPVCEDGSNPTRSGGPGTSLRCPPSTEPDPGASECEDATPGPCVDVPEESPGLIVTPCGEAPAEAATGSRAGRDFICEG
jgi:hypothetical protein